MNIIRFISIIFLAFLFSKCTNYKEAEDFVLQFDLYSKSNDSIHIYYLETDSLDFSEKKSIWKKIDGKNSNQMVEIIFPKDVNPKQFRVDFGHNPSLQEIVINKINFKLNKNEIELKGKEIYHFFRPDDSNTILEKDSGILKRKFENQKAVFSIYPKGNKLQKKIEEIYLKR